MRGYADRRGPTVGRLPDEPVNGPVSGVPVDLGELPDLVGTCRVLLISPDHIYMQAGLPPPCHAAALYAGYSVTHHGGDVIRLGLLAKWCGSVVVVII